MTAWFSHQFSIRKLLGMIFKFNGIIDILHFLIKCTSNWILRSIIYVFKNRRLIFEIYHSFELNNCFFIEDAIHTREQHIQTKWFLHHMKMLWLHFFFKSYNNYLISFDFSINTIDVCACADVVLDVSTNMKILLCQIFSINLAIIFYIWFFRWWMHPANSMHFAIACVINLSEAFSLDVFVPINRYASSLLCYIVADSFAFIIWFISIVLHTEVLITSFSYTNKVMSTNSTMRNRIYLLHLMLL